ncbi:hypothetical protein EVG20_g5527 [Dentipellis fragilis]|uniref:Wax synthase domain-containing protein n=1 Tax=Dentipellis fragilis TaxID=205917 RepID=A0A4Y9YV68_9AGAM|nr:hypothetical protein EVG20_g5527 [Dentipellis fragilis]
MTPGSFESVIAQLCTYIPNPADPRIRKPLTAGAAAPVFLCYYGHAVLVLLDVHKTFPFELALLPMTLWLAYRTAVDYDFAAGLVPALGVHDYQRIVAFNYAYVIGMMVMGLRSIEWTFARESFKRYRDVHGKMELRSSHGFYLFSDALALLFNQRGNGWSWSQTRDSFKTPRNPDPPPSVFSLISTLATRFFIFDIAHYLIQFMYPQLDTAKGDTIYDASLPLHFQALKILFINICAGIVVWSAVDVLYLATAIPSCLFLGYSTSAWPPISNRPWLSESLADFWGRRWHQSFRQIFLAIGYRPFYRYLGNAGGVFGAFAVSALLHDLGMWGSGRGTEFWSVGGFFLMMGVGAVLEGLWERATGRKVCGSLGWAWTMAWVLWWAQFMVDAWARRGFVGTDFVSQKYRPGKWAVKLLLEHITM